MGRTSAARRLVPRRRACRWGRSAARCPTAVTTCSRAESARRRRSVGAGGTRTSAGVARRRAWSLARSAARRPTAVVAWWIAEVARPASTAEASSPTCAAPPHARPRPVVTLASAAAKCPTGAAGCWIAGHARRPRRAAVAAHRTTAVAPRRRATPSEPRAGPHRTVVARRCSVEVAGRGRAARAMSACARTATRPVARSASRIARAVRTATAREGGLA